MKSAGKCASKRSPFSNGACHWAKGIEPESNQTSMTSGTRVIGSPPSSQAKPASSAEGGVGALRGPPPPPPPPRARRAPPPGGGGGPSPPPPPRQRRAPVALARERP